MASHRVQRTVLLSCQISAVIALIQEETHLPCFKKFMGHGTSSRCIFDYQSTNYRYVRSSAPTFLYDAPFKVESGKSHDQL